MHARMRALSRKTFSCRSSGFIAVQELADRARPPRARFWVNEFTAEVGREHGKGDGNSVARCAAEDLARQRPGDE